MDGWMNAWKWKWMSKPRSFQAWVLDEWWLKTIRELGGNGKWKWNMLGERREVLFLGPSLRQMELCTLTHVFHGLLPKWCFVMPTKLIPLSLSYRWWDGVSEVKGLSWVSWPENGGEGAHLTSCTDPFIASLGSIPRHTEQFWVIHSLSQRWDRYALDF